MIQNHLLREIHEQPEALRRIFQHYVNQPNPTLQAAVDVLRGSTMIYFTGMATSEYGSYAASSLLNRSGRTSFVYDVSELLYYHLPALEQPGACLVLVSQSGGSAEIVHILDEVRGKLPIIGVFNDESSYLAQHCDLGLPILAGPQLACGSKTNLSTIAVLLLLAEAVLGNDLQEAGGQLARTADSIERFLDGWEEKIKPAVDFLEGSPYTIFLGRGPSRASALFTATLFREVPKVVAEGMGAAAFRHGLREMIRPEHRVVIFAPEGETYPLLVKLAEDMQAINIPVLLVTNVPAAVQGALVLQTASLPELWAPLLDMVPLQLVGYALAERRGIEPGKLVISTYITTQE